MKMCTLIFVFSAILQATLFNICSVALSQDGITLLDLKSTLNDSNSFLTDWKDSDETPCQWTGISCNADDHTVSSINLPYMQLGGFISPIIGKLRRLQRLALHQNGLHGVIPKEIATCSELRALYLRANYLQGEIPSNIGDLSSLNILDLSSNSITGSIPSSLGRLTRLHYMNLSANFFSGEIPDVGVLSKFRNNSFIGNLDLCGRQINKPCKTSLGFPAVLPHAESDEVAVPTKKSSHYVKGAVIGATSTLTVAFLVLLIFIRVWFLSKKERAVKRYKEVKKQSSNKTGTKLMTFHGDLPYPSCEIIEKLECLTEEDVVGTGGFGTVYRMVMNDCTTFAVKRIDRSREGCDEVFEMELEILGNVKHINLVNLRGYCRLPNAKLLIYDYLALGSLDDFLHDLCGRQINKPCKTSLGFPAVLPHAESDEVAVPTKKSSHYVKGAVIGATSTLTVAFLVLLIFIRVWFLSKKERAVKRYKEVKKQSSNKTGTKLMTFHGDLPYPSCEIIEKLECLTEEDVVGTGGFGTVYRMVMNDCTTFAVKRIDRSREGCDEVFEMELEILGNVKHINLVNLRGYCRLPNAKLLIYDYLALGSLDDFLHDLCGRQINKPCKTSLGFPAVLPHAESDEVAVPTKKSSHYVKGAVIGATSTLTVAFLVLLIFIRVWFLSKKERAVKRYKEVKKQSSNKTGTKLMTFHGDLPYPSCEIIEKLECLTEEDVVGTGGFGTVYRMVMNDCTTFAVKRIDRSREGCDEVFEMELEILGNVKHINLVNLRGYCRLPNAKLLIYDYLALGSLDDFLHEHWEDRSMNWSVRLRVALGSARGLAYLHHDCYPRIIHRDIKSSNILLGENLEPHVSDFGLAKLLVDEDAHVTTVVAGTFGYMAPEYLQSGMATEKSDVYSFGVLLLELVTGKRPTDPAFIKHGLNVVGWMNMLVRENRMVDMVDKRCKDTDLETVEAILEIAARCTDANPDERPQMERVLQLLEQEVMSPCPSDFYDSHSDYA